MNFANKRKSWAYLQDQLPTTHPIVADIPDLEAAKQNFDGITYAKGASVLKQLVAYVGFEAFIAGSRRYFRDHEYGNTSLADLLEALGTASGRDLGTWARQWLQTSGISTIAAEISGNGGDMAAVTLRQDSVDPITGKQEHRPHRLRIGLYNFDDDGRLLRTEGIELDVEGADTPVGALAGSGARPSSSSTTTTSAMPRSAWMRGPRQQYVPRWTASATPWPGPCAGQPSGIQRATPLPRRRCTSPPSNASPPPSPESASSSTFWGTR